MVEINFTLVLQWLNFGVLFFILYHLLSKPILTFLDNRSLQISQDLEGAKKKNQDAAALLAEYELKVKSTEREAQAFMEKIKKEAATEKEKVLQGAEKEAEAIMTRARGEIQLAIDTAKEDLRKEFSKTAIRCAEVVLQKEIDAFKHQAIVHEFIAKDLK